VSGSTLRTWRLHARREAFAALRAAPELMFEGETENGEG
jgi:hypothetical protein